MKFIKNLGAGPISELPPTTEECKLVPGNCRGDLTKSLEATCNGLPATETRISSSSNERLSLKDNLRIYA